ncbi:MAG: hypothetical protein AB8B62_05285 [Roseobacter sp.]
MAVEIGTLVLKGRFGAARKDAPEHNEEVEALMEALRRDLLREIDDRLDVTGRRTRER